MDRREFFRRLSGRKRAMRPPASLPERDFFEHCNSCGDCVSACPQQIVKISAHSLPVIDLAHAGCTFCGDCRTACQHGAFDQTVNIEQSWNWRPQIADSCLDKIGIVCRACEGSCDTRAISFRPALGGRHDVSVSMADCNGCGVCVSACHTGAISMGLHQSSFQTPKEAVA